MSGIGNRQLTQSQKLVSFDGWMLRQKFGALANAFLKLNKFNQLNVTFPFLPFFLGHPPKSRTNMMNARKL